MSPNITIEQTADLGSRTCSAHSQSCIKTSCTAEILMKSCLNVAGQDMPVNRIYSVLWEIFQPLLFGLIGAEIDINKIEGKTIGE